MASNPFIKMTLNGISIPGTYVGVDFGGDRRPGKTESAKKRLATLKAARDKRMSEKKSEPSIIGKCVGVDGDGRTIIVETSSGPGGRTLVSMVAPSTPNESVTCQMLREKIEWLQKDLNEARRNQRKAEEFAAQKRSEAESFRQRLSRYEEINERGSSVGLISPSLGDQYMRQMMQDSERMLYQTMLADFGSGMVRRLVIGPIDEPAKPAGPKPPEPKRGRMHNLDLDDVEKGK